MLNCKDHVCVYEKKAEILNRKTKKIFFFFYNVQFYGMVFQCINNVGLRFLNTLRAYIIRQRFEYLNVLYKKTILGFQETLFMDHGSTRLSGLNKFQSQLSAVI